MRPTKSEKFERKTLKFWVHQNKIPLVTSIVRKFIPISRRGMIHSIYFDDENASMYSARLVRTDGSQLLRFRWYGDDEPQEKGDKVFIEIKTHMNTEPSLKERFSLSPSKAALFEKERGEVQGGVWVAGDEHAQALAQRATALFKEKGLRRVLRSEYYRTAFEDPSNSDYRASLDQTVTLVQDSESTRTWSYNHIQQSSSFIFPYAVLEIKIATAALERSSEVMSNFVTELKTKGGVIEAPKFSKFLTGYAAHYQKSVSVIPSWMSDPSISASHNLSPPAPPPPAFCSPPPSSPLPIDRVQDYKKTKSRLPDQKSIMANERTLLAWVRTTMLLLYGSSFFLDHELPGFTNKVIGWTGILASLFVVIRALKQYNMRNDLLLKSETQLGKFVDGGGVNFLGVGIVVVSVAGFVSYQKSVLTYNNWHIYGEGGEGGGEPVAG
ncbi:hypothetical protein TrVE_jg10653 [Triparma verrucosa]|uniref:DUF202 domain-containing protein n=1 Tax=Triparma verrucosa TaxID=1606542 RepID=A0A9W7FAE0_9STRA|nr:hypothetical protein TrVE_jg10653 [Triparma verrucosa]